MIRKYELPPDDGAPFTCEIYDEAPRPVFFERCTVPAICGIDGSRIPKYWEQPNYLYTKTPTFVCATHFTWINNHHEEVSENITVPFNEWSNK